MIPHVELYGARTGNCLRAAIALEECGIEYVVRRVDLRRGEQYGPAHLERNPQGKVPTLVDRTRLAAVTLSQSNAITLYADEMVPGRIAPALPGPARAQVLERFFYFVTDVIVPGFDAFWLRSQGSGDAAVQLDQRVLEGLAWADRFVTTAPFLAGDAFSMADIAAFTVARSLESSLDWGTLKNLAPWYRLIASRPGVHRGLHAFD